MKFKKIENEFRHRYISEDTYGGVQWTITWNDEGYWTVAYITERGDLIGLDDTFNMQSAIKLIEKTIKSWE